MSYVSITELSHKYEDLEVLQNINLEIVSGEFLAIVGPSGCGKSTILRILAGLLKPTSGQVQVEGSSAILKPGAVSFLPQNDLLMPWRKAIDNATLGLEIAGFDKAEARDRAQKLFERFGLSGFENSWPHELSGGMRQRVAVLRSFLISHPVLALDEPFGALDALTRRSMQQWLEELWESDRRTTLLVTHDVEEAILVSDRIIVMSKRPGRILEEIKVDFPRPRTLELGVANEFTNLRQKILGILSGELDGI